MVNTLSPEELESIIEEEGFRKPRGTLTEGDIRWLFGVDELSGNAEYKRRHDLRKRLKHSLMDFQILFEKLPHGDFLETINNLQDDENEEALVFAMAFLISRNPLTGDELTGFLENVIKEAVSYRNMMNGKLHDDCNVDVTIDMGEERDLLSSGLSEGEFENLSDHELEVLENLTKIDGENWPWPDP